MLECRLLAVISIATVKSRYAAGVGQNPGQGRCSNSSLIEDPTDVFIKREAIIQPDFEVSNWLFPFNNSSIHADNEYVSSRTEQFIFVFRDGESPAIQACDNCSQSFVSFLS